MQNNRFQSDKFQQQLSHKPDLKEVDWFPPLKIEIKYRMPIDTFDQFRVEVLYWALNLNIKADRGANRATDSWTATVGSDVVQSGRPIFDDFFQHLWPYIGNNMVNVVFQMVKRLWLIRIDQ
ncbi:hypothetical protein TNCV_3418591 [Trichonephila clavipes]|nr:hypothetical protein TNCV_3418591 [Trichonephila clavipes]